MEESQKFYPELIYRINFILKDFASELPDIGAVLSPNVFDPYCRRFHWLTVHEDFWWVFEDISFTSFHKNFCSKINENKRSWNAYKRQYYNAGLKEYVDQAFKILEERQNYSPSPDELNRALLTLHQFYPIDPEKYIDGILWRNLKRRSKNKKRSHKVDFAEAELLLDLHETYIESPWAKVVFYNEKDNYKEIKYSCQEKFQSKSPSIKFDLDVDKKKSIQELTDSLSYYPDPSLRKKNDFYFNFIMRHFFGYPGMRDLSKFFDIKAVSKEEIYQYILVLPIYDAKIGKDYFGNLCCNLQIGFQKKGDFELFKNKKDQLLFYAPNIIQEIKKAAINEIVKTDLGGSEDFLEYFIKHWNPF